MIPKALLNWFDVSREDASHEPGSIYFVLSLRSVALLITLGSRSRKQRNSPRIIDEGQELNRSWPFEELR